METAVNDLVNLLIKNLSGEIADQVSFEAHFDCSRPTQKGYRCTTCINCLFFELLSEFSQKAIESVITCNFDELILLAIKSSKCFIILLIRLGRDPGDTANKNSD